MNGRKVYRGEHYSFYRKNHVGSGGNGSVYNIELVGNDKNCFPYSLVAKFFSYNGKDKEKRYNRFRNEIEFMERMNGIDGIMTVLDKHCPQSAPLEDEAWFLMAKALPYQINADKEIGRKLSEMIELARIIERIHDRGYAHRDIKPENILLLNNRIILSDYGMYWGVNEERLTTLNERIGPYKIMPPEFEKVQTELDIDYCFSDVYLFAKVLWMTIKRDTVGFRGHYQRGEAQIYLNKAEYNNVLTFEPIHKLLEEATIDDITKRINIKKCIKYLELQYKIIDERKRESLPDYIIKQLLYDEQSKRIVSRTYPSTLVYNDKSVIYNMLKGTLPYSEVFVKLKAEDKADVQISVSDFHVIKGDVCKFVYYFKNIIVKEYLMNIANMSYSNHDSTITLELLNLDSIESGYISIDESVRGLGSVPKVYFSSNNKIVIKKTNTEYD